MIYMMLLILGFSLFIMIKRFTCKYTWFLVLMCFSLVLTTFASVLCISSLGNYPMMNNLFLYPDYKMFQILSCVRLPYSVVIKLRNIGIMSYIALMPLFIIQYTAPSRKWKTPRNLIKSLTYMIFPLYGLWFYSPETNYSIYISYQMAEAPKRNIIEAFVKGVDFMNYMIIFIYLLYVVLKMYRCYKYEKIDIMKKQCMALLICLGTLNILFLIMLVIGPWKKLYFFSFAESLLMPVPYINLSKTFYISLPLLMFSVIILMLVIIFKFYALDTVDIFRQHRINKSVMGLDSDLRGVFHSLKNTLFIFHIYAQQASNSTSIAERESIVGKIDELAIKSMNDMNHILDSFKSLKLVKRKCNLASAIDEALKRIELQENITLEKSYQDMYIQSSIDYYYIVDVLVNILKNAQEAIVLAEREKGKIGIELFSEHEWAVIKITDNGVGIEKSKINKIFKPFYSTKSGRNNWGVGLAYAFRVIKAHLGFMTVKSEIDKYTTFQILLYKA